MPAGRQRPPVPGTVETAARVGDRRVHLFQVVREARGDGSTRDWLVVGLDAGDVELASPDFEWHRRVPGEGFDRYEPLVEGGVPVWGY